MDPQTCSRAPGLTTDRAGVTALEYALIAGIMAVAILAAMTVFAPGLNNLYVNTANAFNQIPNAS